MPLLEEGPRLVEESLERGMFPSLAPERIPKGGAEDITNGLLDEQNVVYRRGGTTFLDQTPHGDPRLLWSGFLRAVAGEHRLLATDGGSFVDGSAVALTAPSALTRAQVFEGILYLPGGVTWDGATAGTATNARGKKAFYATAGGRLLAGEGNQIYFSQIPAKAADALTWAETDFHALPDGVQITGMEGLRTSCVVFTTEGIWLIGGLNRELTDAEGNIQQTLDRYSPNAVLWGNNGVAGWQGGLIVPCKDHIWLTTLGVSSERAAPFVHIDDAIESVYRNYVGAGYKPGVAAVHRGHYFLPIVNGSDVIDMLVCRLDSTNSRGQHTYPWTHFADYGSRVAAMASTDEDVGLIGATAGVGRTLNLSYFEPSTALSADADGTPHSFSVTYRDLMTGNLVPNLVRKARLSYRLVAPGDSALVMSFSSTSWGTRWNEFLWNKANWIGGGGPFNKLEGEAPPDAEALHPFTWRVRRRVRFARVKVDLKGPAGSVSLRSLELFTRSSGRL